MIMISSLNFHLCSVNVALHPTLRPHKRLLQEDLNHLRVSLDIRITNNEDDRNLFHCQENGVYGRE